MAHKLSAFLVLAALASPALGDDAATRRLQLQQAAAKVEALNGGAMPSGAAPAAPHQAGPARGDLTIVAHKFYDTYKKIDKPIEVIRISPNGRPGRTVTVYNPGRLNELTAVYHGFVGDWYNVDVHWRGGGAHRWDYQIKTGPNYQLDIYTPL